MIVHILDKFSRDGGTGGTDSSVWYEYHTKGNESWHFCVVAPSSDASIINVFNADFEWPVTERMDFCTKFHLHKFLLAAIGEKEKFECDKDVLCVD